MDGSILKSEQVGSQLPVAVFGGPQVERDGRKFVNNGYGMAILSQINSLEIATAAVAGFHTDMIEFLAGVYGELARILFTTRRADNPAIVPFGCAQGANQRPLRAIALGPQRADGRLTATNWAD